MAYPQYGFAFTAPDPRHTWSFYARASYRNWNAPDTRYTLVGMRLPREADADGR